MSERFNKLIEGSYNNFISKYTQPEFTDWLFCSQSCMSEFDRGRLDCHNVQGLLLQVNDQGLNCVCVCAHVHACVCEMKTCS